MAIADNPNITTASYHDRLLARQLEDPEFRREYERSLKEIEAVDAIVNALDTLRGQHDMTKAELAREIDKNPASIRRLFGARSANPELRTIVALANALDADIQVIPRKRSRRHRAS